MPTFERGNMWEIFGKTGLFLITTNPIVRKDGAIVMGRGIAKELKDRYPSLPYDFGRQRDPKIVGYQGITSVGLIGTYGLQAQRVGYFMVKSHWAKAAELPIIEDSVYELLEWCHHYDRIDLNFPGIGNGKLRREDVLPLVELLPEYVHIWEFE